MNRQTFFTAFLINTLILLGAAQAHADALASVLDDKAALHYEARFHAVHELPKQLQPDDAKQLLEFLARPLAKERLSESEIGAIKNDVADLLIAQPTLPDGIEAQFLAMLNDPAQGAVWRNYVLQKLPELHNRLNAPKQRESLRKALWEATQSDTSGYPGTALLGLMRLSNASPDEVTLAELGERALEVASNEQAATPDRLTALQIASEAGQPEVLTLARELFNSDAPIMLRSSAIAVIGKQGDATDLATLEPLLKSSDIRLREAAKSAIASLKRS